MTRILRFFLAAFLCLIVAACARLPAGGPASNDLTSEAKKQKGSEEFAVYEVNRALVPVMAKWPETGSAERLSWIGKTQGAGSLTIQADDTLNLQIWDSTDNSLLTSLAQRVVSLDKVLVAANGTIFVPYVGEVRVAGLTPDRARKKLQSELEVIVASVQVQLSLNEGRANSVELVSGVASPGPYPMKGRNFTVRSLIAAGGGISPSFKNPQVRLVRGSKIFGTPVEKLLNNPNYDTQLHGGDQVFIEEDSRYFLSLGATGSEALHLFTRDRMSAMDALAVIGGVNDTRADPKGLLILREYPASAVKPGGPGNSRVVFSIDLTSFDGLFSARNFRINPSDLVVATEAPINDVLTISTVIGRLLGIASTASKL
tara:strand:- start:1419 stop:2534 length:1116 start_codon:yes stop_codon:yes gene_type:complete